MLKSMEEIEVPLEQVHEHVHHAHQHEQNRWLNLAALSTAVLAVFAAISALFAGHFANDAMIEQIKASNQWSYYQAKGIKLAIAEMREQDTKIEKYKSDQEAIMEDAQKEQAAAERHLAQHQWLAFAVTLFQVAIALSAIAVLAKKHVFVYGSLALGVLGLVFLSKGFIP